MAFDRRTGALYGLPIATLVLAIILQLGIVSAEHAVVPVRIVLSLLAIALVFATVFAALRHAEAIAHHIGEPYGTLVLTFAVTTIEVSVIVAMMLHGENNPTLARESVFSTVMIICGGVVGFCLTFGGLRHRHQELKRQGTNAYLAVLTALAVLILVLPNFTLSAGHGTFSPAQLAFVSVMSVLLYGSFVYAQMGLHRDDFVEELIEPGDRKHPFFARGHFHQRRSCSSSDWPVSCSSRRISRRASRTRWSRFRSSRPMPSSAPSSRHW